MELDPTGQQPFFPAGTKPQDIIPALRGLGQAFVDPSTITGQFVKALMAPGQALQSTTPISTGEMIKPAVDLASVATTGGVPMAEAGAAGIFGGKLARGANLEKMTEASRMERAGHAPKEIWDQTGWFKGDDGKWRFEIPDRAATINKNLPNLEDGLRTGGGENLEKAWTIGGGPTDIERRVIPDRGGNPLSAEIIKHDALYENYPHLRNAEIFDLSQHPQGVSAIGSYFKPEKANNYRNQIGLGPASLLDMRSVALHELQHAVQNYENFASGSSIGKFPGLSPGEAYLKYASTPGELEARNVQIRADMQPWQRMSIPPWESAQWVHPKVNTQMLINKLRGQ